MHVHSLCISEVCCYITCICPQVDLKCVEPGDGGYYYPDHLPTLGE